MEKDNECITEAEWNRFEEIDKNIGEICANNPDGILSKADVDLIIHINTHVINCEECHAKGKIRFADNEETPKTRH